MILEWILIDIVDLIFKNIGNRWLLDVYNIFVNIIKEMEFKEFVLSNEYYNKYSIVIYLLFIYFRILHKFCRFK